MQGLKTLGIFYRGVKLEVTWFVSILDSIVFDFLGIGAFWGMSNQADLEMDSTYTLFRNFLITPTLLGLFAFINDSDACPQLPPVTKTG